MPASSGKTTRLHLNRAGDRQANSALHHVIIRPVAVMGTSLPHPAFVKLAKTIRNHRASIVAAIEHGLSNGRIESVNTKIRLTTRIPVGFKSPEALFALAMLNLGGHRPARPGRS